VDKGYRKSYVYYNRLFFVEKKQVRDYYMNDIMARAVRDGGPPPDGAIIVLEVYGARTDARGEAMLDRDGKLIPGALNVVSVMETKESLAKQAPADIRNGNWVYFFFSPDFQDKTTEGDRKGCLACHRSKADQHYIFTYEDMKKVVK